MLYLLDANVLITAQREYYALDQVPEFWEWVLYEAEQGNIKMPLEIINEIGDGGKGSTPLLDWIRNPDNKKILTLDEEVELDVVRKVVTEGYAHDLTDDEVELLGRDPILIAYALADKENRCVVTLEVFSSNNWRYKKKIPNICKFFSIKCINTFELTRVLGFKTSWRK